MGYGGEENLGYSDHEMAKSRSLRGDSRAKSNTAKDFRKGDFTLFKDVLGRILQENKRHLREMVDFQG